MEQQIYNGKKVIWESKTKLWFSVFVCLMFVAIGMYCCKVEEKFTFLFIILFFGIGALMQLVRLLNPKNLFVTYESELGKEVLKEKFIRAQETLGFFSYDNDSFTFLDKVYSWNDISTVFAFKLDLMTTDEVCVDLFMNDGLWIKIDESTPGWFQFTKRLNQQFTISDEWESNIIHPAFATNMTLLFDRQGRSLDECVSALYD